MTKTGLYRFLSRSKLGVLGSIDGGKPQSALVGIAVTPELEIIFDTVRSSRKFHNLTTRPCCTFVIGWTGEQTVQYEGVARLLQSPELEPYRETYFGTWPDGKTRVTWPGIVWFAVRPSWIRFSDFDAPPPLIEEFHF